MKFQNHLTTVCCVVLGLVFVVSCSDSSSNSVPPENNNETPRLPPANSMTVDLSVFSSGEIDSSSIKNYANYLHADSTIGMIEAIKGRNIDIVRNLFENADTTEAVKLEDGGWEWTYSNEDSSNNKISINYAVGLVAHRQNDDKIKWDVFFSLPSENKARAQNTSPVHGNRIISGITNNQVTQGEWTYYSPPRFSQPQQEMATLDWQIDKNQNIDMKLKLLASNFSGSVMEYHTEGAIRTIALAPAENGKTTIAFNAESQAGFIISPNYNSGEKACWNADLKDVSCSEISL